MFSLADPYEDDFKTVRTYSKVAQVDAIVDNELQSPTRLLADDIFIIMLRLCIWTTTRFGFKRNLEEAIRVTRGIDPEFNIEMAQLRLSSTTDAFRTQIIVPKALEYVRTIATMSRNTRVEQQRKNDLFDQQRRAQARLGGFAPKRMSMPQISTPRLTIHLFDAAPVLTRRGGFVSRSSSKSKLKGLRRVRNR
jgi:hypothetical protein